jgi:hypothetical protein
MSNPETRALNPKPWDLHPRLRHITYTRTSTTPPNSQPCTPYPIPFAQSYEPYATHPAPLHRRTVAHLRPCTLAPLHPYYPYYPYTVAPLHPSLHPRTRVTLAPSHPCTFAPLHRYAPIPCIMFPAKPSTHTLTPEPLLSGCTTSL